MGKNLAGNGYKGSFKRSYKDTTADVLEGFNFVNKL
jgi:hypothetical protein